MRRLILFLIPFFWAALVLAPASSRAQRLTIEAESFTSYSDTGGDQIQSLPLSGCSGGYFLFGLDTPGEWTQYDVPVTVPGVFSFALKCRGALNREYSFRAVFTPVSGGSAQTVGFNFTGQGFS